MQFSNTEEEWNKIAADFLAKLNFNNCIGAMDGKHVLINPPANSGSYFFNYKHSFSLVLLAVVDAAYKFICISVGCNGRISDGGVFRNSDLYHHLEENKLNIPRPATLPGTQTKFPHVLVADDAFPLKEYILKPYSQIGLTKKRRIFNYRLSRAWRVVENAFGILANCFPIFMTPISLTLSKVEYITMACCSLHNFLHCRTDASALYTPPDSIDRENPLTHACTPGNWRSGSQSTGFAAVARQGSNNYTCSAKNMRDQLCQYFNSKAGEVSWQNDMI